MGDHHHGPAKGLGRWLFTTNHKDIGTMYLWFSFSMFILGGFFAMVIRAELFQPGMQLVEPAFFNQMTTLHGLVMVFGAIMPSFVGLANWLIPMMIGAPDMALPRMNNWSFWILPPAFLLLASTLFMEGGAPAAGWTFYAPLSTTYAAPSVTYFIFCIHVLGLSSIMGSINIIATVMNMRAPGMTYMKMPLFVWTWLITAFLLVAVMPVLAGAVTMMLMDVHFGTSFFSAAGGGDPVLFQHVFWFFGHPEVYIIILPAFGVVSQIIPAFSRKPLFGYDSMVYATASIAFLSFIVWAHHMYTVGMPVAGELFFMYATMLIAVPTGVKVFNWVTTMWRGSLSFETPMLFSIGFLVLFTIGGFTGLMLSIAPADFQYHDSYFVVAHFHYVMVAGAVFSMSAAIYFWLPKWCGRMYNETMGKTHFWISFIGFNLAFFPQHFVGLAGMPRRIPDYALQFADFNMMSSIGAFIYGASQILFLYNVIATIVAGKPVSDPKVWDGAEGLEWTIPTPAPYHTFETPPAISKAQHVLKLSDNPAIDTATKLVAVAVLMFAFVFVVMVPLYNVLCDALGINGKTSGAAYTAVQAGVDENRLVSIQFVATNNEGMPWEFGPTVSVMKVHPGAINETVFNARNPLARDMIGQAIPSVSPARAAPYFHKTECFCFNQQPLAAGAAAELPLQYIVDMDLPADIKTITLSYTIFDVTDMSAGAVAAR